MNALRSLPRIEEPARFYEDYFLARKPVVITGVARRMPAFSRWTDEYLVDVLGDSRATVRLASGKHGRVPFDDFLRYLAEPEAFDSSHGPAYLTDFYVRPPFQDARRAKLSADVMFPLERGGAFAEWMTIYAGPPHTATSMHQDIFNTHTWLAELRGDKTWRLCAPDELDAARAAVADAFDGSDLGCTVWNAILSPGDLIYLPPNWWHQVRNESTSTLAISGNFCSFDEAHAHLVDAGRQADPVIREQWSRQWSAILALEATT